MPMCAVGTVIPSEESNTVEHQLLSEQWQHQARQWGSTVTIYVEPLAPSYHLGATGKDLTAAHNWGSHDTWRPLA